MSLITGKAIVLFGLGIMMSFQAAAGGGWTLEKGEIWSQLSGTYIRSGTLFNGTGSKLNLQRPVTDITTQLWLEYGIHERVTLMGVLPVKHVSTSGPPAGNFEFDTLQEGSMTWFGNFRLGAKYRVTPANSETVLAVQGWIESNNGDMNQYPGLQTGINAWSFSPGIAFGKSFGNSYLAGDASFTLRNNEHSEEVFVNLEYGFHVRKYFWLTGVFSIQKSLKNGEYKNCNFSGTGLYVNNQESINYGLKAMVPLAGEFGFSAAVYGSMYGDQVAAFPSLNAGIYWNRKPGRKDSDRLR